MFLMNVKKWLNNCYYFMKVENMCPCCLERLCQDKKNLWRLFVSKEKMFWKVHLFPALYCTNFGSVKKPYYTKMGLY